MEEFGRDMIQFSFGLSVMTCPESPHLGVCFMIFITYVDCLVKFCELVLQLLGCSEPNPKGEVSWAENWTLLNLIFLVLGLGFHRGHVWASLDFSKSEINKFS